VPNEKVQIYKITCLISGTKITINTIEYEHGSLLEFHLHWGRWDSFLSKKINTLECLFFCYYILRFLVINIASPKEKNLYCLATAFL
jgi:hypothetical protein